MKINGYYFGAGIIFSINVLGHVLDYIINHIDNTKADIFMIINSLLVIIFFGFAFKNEKQGEEK